MSRSLSSAPLMSFRNCTTSWPSFSLCGSCQGIREYSSLPWFVILNFYVPKCLFPVYRFPSKMVLGRTHIKDVASKRKVELSSYVHNLMRSSTEVNQVGEFKFYLHNLCFDILQNIIVVFFSLISGSDESTNCVTQINVHRFLVTRSEFLTFLEGYVLQVCIFLIIIFYFSILKCNLFDLMNFQHHYSSLQCHMIRQKSFSYTDLVLKKHYYRSWKKHFNKKTFHNTSLLSLLINIMHPCLIKVIIYFRKELLLNQNFRTVV